MDKYEKLAEEYICGSRIFSVDGDNAKALADAFRWFDEQREKETCEWNRWIGPEGIYWKSSCNIMGLDLPTHRYCNCSRRIVEKEGE